MLKLLRSYFSLTPSGRGLLILVVVLSVASALLQGVSIGMLLPALQLVEQQTDVAQAGLVWQVLGTVFSAVHLPMTLFSLLAGVLVMITMGQALFFVQYKISAMMSRRFVDMLRQRTYQTFMDADMIFHHRAATGNLTSHLTQDIHRTGAVFESVLQFISRSILIVFYSGMMALLSWRAALGTLLLVLSVSALVYFQMKRSSSLGPKMVQANNALYSYVVERLGLVRIMKLWNAKEAEGEHFGALSREAANLKYQHECQSAQIRLIMEPTLAAGGILAIYIGVTYLGMALSELAVFLFVLIRMVPEAYTLNRLRHAVSGYIGHFYRVTQAIDHAKQLTNITGGGRLFVGFDRSLEFIRVTASYEEGVPVLRNVSLTIEKGSFTAIVGPSGSGKSTILDLIARLMDPEHGEILIDDQNIRQFDITSLRQSMGIVSQDILLLNDTVLENIRYGHVNVSEGEVVEAAKCAHAHEFIRQLPRGYETIIGSRGLMLSGGERQRLELARVFLRKPSILLLDEATSSLDAESERLVQESVQSLLPTCTVIMVTHRLNLLHMVHKVVVINGGVVSAVGSPTMLLEVDGSLKKHYSGHMEVVP